MPTVGIRAMGGKRMFWPLGTIHHPGVQRRRVAGWLLPGCGALAIGLVMAVTACASSGVSPGSEGVWREDMGRMSRETMVAGLDRIVRKHALKVDREQERNREFVYELAWISRDVTAEEEVFGVTDARNRIVIRGRTSGGVAGGTDADVMSREVYRVSWELQNEVVSVTNPEWHSGRIPELVVERFRPIFADLGMEIRSGLNR